MARVAMPFSYSRSTDSPTGYFHFQKAAMSCHALFFMFDRFDFLQ